MNRDHMLGYMPPLDPEHVKALRRNWLIPKDTSRMDKSMKAAMEQQAYREASTRFETGDHHPDGTVTYGAVYSKDDPSLWEQEYVCKQGDVYDRCVVDPSHSHGIFADSPARMSRRETIRKAALELGLVTQAALDEGQREQMMKAQEAEARRQLSLLSQPASWLMDKPV